MKKNSEVEALRAGIKTFQKIIRGGYPADYSPFSTKKKSRHNKGLTFTASGRLRKGSSPKATSPTGPDFGCVNHQLRSEVNAGELCPLRHEQTSCGEPEIFRGSSQMKIPANYPEYIRYMYGGEKINPKIVAEVDEEVRKIVAEGGGGNSLALG